ncbi:MAG TPA: hypothetical protein VLV78_10985 [Thermoanaerobaculia bacterium]|nr:hypothetical protein [Thermoanaerobaculia bacterium]
MSNAEKHVNRRQFLVTGSLAVAGLTMPGVMHAAAKAPAAALPLSVGFLADASRSFQAAESILTGDPTLFSRSARFSFRGMRRFPSDNLNVLIDVIFHTVAGDVPFFAFTHPEAGKSVSNSSPASFLVPVPTTGAIDLSVKVRRASAPEVSGTISFAVNSVSDALKLNRGAYILAISDRAIDWTSVRLADGTQPSTFISGGEPLLLRTNDANEVSFDYVVMTVRAGS